MSRFSSVGTRAVVLCTAFLAALVLVATPGEASVVRARPPATPRGLPSAIEPLAPYVEQVSCDPRLRPGTVKLAHLLADTYRGLNSTNWASTYSCGTDGTRSEHYDGRAIDWMVDVHNPRQHAAANAVLKWLLATDRPGNRFAMARRLGVMYVIYNNRMWGAWDGKWEQYNGCSHLPQRANDNACHRTHMHISLSWNGAMGRTSFWTKRVAPTDYGQCRARGMNWAYLYTRANRVPCRHFPGLRPARSASATKRALVTYAGAAVRRGWSGPAVSAVQHAVHVAATGRYTGATVAAVRRFQARHRGCPTTGAMNTRTWRALLAVVR